MKIQPEVAAIVGKVDFDPDALFAKYMSERDKRVREDGIDQYVEVKAEFSRYVEDPYVTPGFTRAPVLLYSTVTLVAVALAKPLPRFRRKVPEASRASLPSGLISRPSVAALTPTSMAAPVVNFAAAF